MITQTELQSNDALPVLAPDEPLIVSPVDPACELIVAIPVRDESAGVTATLQALTDQVDLAGNPLDHRSYEIILLANNCVDNTVEMAHRFASRHSSLRLRVVDLTLPDRIFVGQARRLAMDEALHRLAGRDFPSGVIATTDGDTLVSPTWIAATLYEIGLGVDAVGGRISLTKDDLASMDTHRRYFHLLDVGYRYLVAELESRLDPLPHDPWRRHFQHFGASMAVTADAYRRAGGIPALRCLEDVAFFHALERIDAQVRHSPLVRVTTSARESDRTGFGFGVQLNQWEMMSREGQCMLVESPACVEERIRLRRLLRDIWTMQVVDDDTAILLSVRLGVNADWLHSAILAAPTFGQLRQQVEARQEEAGWWHQRWPRVDVRQAISGLRERLARR